MQATQNQYDAGGFPVAAPVPADGQRFRSFREFYPFYLYEHRNNTSRRLHFIGTCLLILPVVAAVVFQNPWLVLLIPVVGYGFAWVGHAFFEKNKPATFQYPGYSLRGDFTMWADILRGKIKW